MKINTILGLLIVGHTFTWGQKILYTKTPLPIVRNIDSLEKRLRLINDPMKRLECIFLLEVNAYSYQPQKFGTYLEEFKELGQQLKITAAEAHYYRFASIIARRKGDTKLAVEYLKRSMETSRRHQDTLNLVRAMISMVSLHSDGLVQGSFNNLEEALKIADEALVLAHKVHSPYDVNTLYSLKGFALKKQENYAEATEMFQLAINTLKPLKDYSRFEFNQINNLVSALIMQKKYEESYQELKKIYPRALKIQDNSSPFILYNLAYCCRELGRFSEGEKYLNQGFQIVAKNGNRPLILEYYHGFKQLYEANKEFKKSLLYADKYRILKDSLFTTEKLNQINELQVRYETEKKDLELARQKIKLVENERKNNLLWIYFLSGVGLLLAVSIYLLFRQLKAQEKVLKAQEEARKQAQKAQEAEAFSYTVSHDLRQPLIQVYQALSRIQSTSQLDLATQQKIAQAQQTLQQADGMVKSLLWLSQLSDEPLHLSTFDTEELIKNIIGQMDWQESFFHFSTPLPTSTADRFLLKQVWANLLSNAVKFSADAVQVSIQIAGRQEKDKLVFEVTDNGIGLSPSQQASLFQPFKRLHDPEKYEGTGLGLVIAKRIVERHGGRIWAESKSNGALFGFSIPLLDR
jgi:signal transduction histidine kinase